MAGSPTEAEVQTQWTNAIDVLESFRVHADDTQAVAAGKLDVLEQSLEGDFTPAGIGSAAANFRSGLSGLIDPSVVREFLDPILFEYAKVISNDAGGDTFGGGYTTTDEILQAMYDFFVAQVPDTTIETRGITFGSPAITTAVGDGVLSRLTLDENNYELEACTVEKKHFRCRSDQNSGTLKFAEVFEHLGSAASLDNLLKGSTGSGVTSTTTIRSRHAGGGEGGSLLTNGSFSTFTASATPQFNGWDETLGGAAVQGDITQDTTNFYRSFPGASTDASLKIAMNSAGDNIVLTQPLVKLNTQQLRRDRPYFLRVMWNGTVGSAVGGTIKMRLGSQEVTVAVAQSGWVELLVPLDQNSWFNNFNQDTFGIDLEVDAMTAGFVLFDDMILCEMDLIDGTYWNLRLNDAAPTAWLVDDEITVTDSYDVAFGNGTLQYYLFLAYGRYLPHSGTPTIADP